MAVNLRELAESDLAETLEGEFGLPVILTDPAGVRQTVEGQILYDTVILDPDEETLTLVGRDFRTGDVVWKGTLGDEAPDSIAIDEAMDLVYVLQGSRFGAFRPHLEMPPPSTLNPWQ